MAQDFKSFLHNAAVALAFIILLRNLLARAFFLFSMDPLLLVLLLLLLWGRWYGDY